MLKSIEAVSQVVFREPDGQKQGLLFAGLSVGCVLLWVSVGVIFGGSNDWPSPFLLFISLAWGFLGIAESLPPSRQRLVATLRIGAISIPVAMVIHLALVPAFYV
jgi:hypothetical protein